MNRNKKRATLLGLASSLVLSLTACDTQALNNNLNSSEEHTESQEINDNLLTENEQLAYKESGSETKYSYLDLYVLNTGKFGAEVPTYYIVKIDRYLNTSIGESAYRCGVENCYYAEKKMKKKYHCYAEVYKTIGLEEEKTIYRMAHYPTGNKDANIYFSINDNLSILEQDGENFVTSKTVEFQTFEDSIVAIYSVIPFTDLKEKYTESDIIDLMTRMNSGEYEFKEGYAQKLDK